MEKVALSRAYLETLSFSELVKIADDEGIDVPEDFNRNFLIAEILEVYEDLVKTETEEMIISEEEVEPREEELVPRAYNSTEVEMLLRNPVWAFVYWNISDSDRISLEKASVSQMRLRVNSFSEKDQIKPDEFFDIQISKEDNGQYVLLPQDKKFFRVDLLFNLDNIVDILASSKVLEKPKGSERFALLQPGKIENISEIMKLSGMEELLLEHYKNHRESFS